MFEIATVRTRRKDGSGPMEAYSSHIKSLSQAEDMNFCATRWEARKWLIGLNLG